MIYVVVVKGTPPVDLARRVAQAHAEAVKVHQRRGMVPVK
jgi:hypothetical protein